MALDPIQQKLVDLAPKLLKLMPGRATVLRHSATPDGAGGQTDARVAVYTDVPCRVDPQKGILADKVVERLLGPKQTGLAAYVITLPLGTLVENDDVIVVGPDSFEVIGRSVSSYRMDVRAVALQVIA